MVFFILSFFIMGLTGGFSHCIAMCHPFVLYISTKYPETGYRLLIPQLKYNLGRTLTYTYLGLTAGFLGGAILQNNVQSWLRIAAGVFLVVFAIFSALGKRLPIPSKIAHMFQKVSLPDSAFLTGIVLGFLPCGISYGAIAASVANASPIGSALAMLAFGLGCTVALMLLALFGGLVLQYINKVRWIFAAIMAGMGIKFVYQGLEALGMM